MRKSAMEDYTVVHFGDTPSRFESCAHHHAWDTDKIRVLFSKLMLDKSVEPWYYMKAV